MNVGAAINQLHFSPEKAAKVIEKTLRSAVSNLIQENEEMKLDPEVLGIKEVKEIFGVEPNKVIDVQALAGDSSDNVPGVPGIGVKTAAELINKYGNLEKLLKSAHEIKQNKRRETLIENKDKALISKKLVTLKSDVPINKNLTDLELKSINRDKLYRFRSYISRSTRMVHHIFWVIGIGNIIDHKP